MGQGIHVVERNKKAFHEYHIEDELEAGIVLKGSEAKSARQGKVSLEGAFCAVDRNGDMILHGAYIKPYEQAGHFNHDGRRNRKLLMHKREIERWREAAQQKGYTIVPLQMHFRNGWAKLKIGLAKGKKLYDKRQDIKERDVKRQLQQTKKAYNR